MSEPWAVFEDDLRQLAPLCLGAYRGLRGDDYDEVLQRARVKLLKRGPELAARLRGDPAKRRAYLRTFLRFTAMEFSRGKRGRHAPLDLVGPVPANRPGPLDYALAGDLGDFIAAAIASHRDRDNIQLALDVLTDRTSLRDHMSATGCGERAARRHFTHGLLALRRIADRYLRRAADPPGDAR